MDNRNEEIEIDLVRMAKYLISKWKIVLVLGIIFAALGFTFKFLNYQLSSVPLAEVDKLFKIEREVKQPNGQIQKVESKVSYRLYVEDYESKMAKYNADLDNFKTSKELLSKKIEMAEKLVDDQKNYLNTSIVYNLKPECYYEDVYLYVVNDDSYNSSNFVNSTKSKDDNKKSNSETQLSSGVNPGLSYAIKYLSSNEFALKVAKALNLKSYASLRNVHELFEIKVNGSDSFNLIVKGNSLDSLKLIENLLKEVDSKINTFCENKYKFNAVLVSSGLGEIKSLNELQKNELLKLEELQSDLNLTKVEASSVVEPVKFENYGKLATLEGYKFNKLLMYFFAGFFGGIFIALCYFTCRYLFEGKLRDENYVSNAFGIVKVCSIYRNRNANILDNSGLKKLGSYIDYLYENGIRSIRFVSTLDKDLCSELSVFLSDVKSRLNADISIISAAEISKAAKADAVILFEKTDISNLNEVVDEVKSILAVKEKISGIVYG